MVDTDRLDEVVTGVLKNTSYHAIDVTLIESLAAAELTRGRSVKDAIKQTRSKLHQVAVAYQEKAIPFPTFLQELQQLPDDVQSPESKSFSRQVMEHHRSTAERLPILETMYADVFSVMPPIRNILDLACGLNPLAFPWMALPALQQYQAMDIYRDMRDFLQSYFNYMHIPGTAQICDLTHHIPEQNADLIILLKTIPCLEQMDKSMGRKLLDTLNASYILVSYPGRSLGGRNKGMPAFYTTQFQRLCEGKPWRIREWRYDSELVFLIEK